MRVLVTGAAGFIGSHLCEALLARGDTVGGIDNYTTGHNDSDGIVYGDITARPVLYELANDLQPELIVHCAASYSDPLLWHRDIDTNTSGTVNVINAARYHDARLVYFQTSLPPISSYAISKIAGQQYIELSGVPHLIFRLANIYGPRNLSGPIPTFYKRLTAGEPGTVVDTFRDMVYIGDLVRGVLRALDLEAEGVFDMCSGTEHPISDLYYAVADALGIVEEPTRRTAGSDDVKSMRLDPARASGELDWHPTVPLTTGVREAVAWYSDHGVTNTYTHLRLREGTRT